VAGERGRQRTGELFHQRGDRQPGEVDRLGPRHLEQPVERPGDTVDRQHGRGVGA
jgi:hypothetical protein